MVAIIFTRYLKNSELDIEFDQGSLEKGSLLFENTMKTLSKNTFKRKLKGNEQIIKYFTSS